MEPVMTLGLLGLGASALGSLFGFGSSQAYNAQQRDMFNDSLRFNEEQADLNRTFAHNEAALAFEREADYNSFKSQLSRMSKAGINPNTINQQLSSSANATAASGSAAVAPSLPNQNFYDLGANIKSVVNDTFQNYLLRKEADKAGSEGRRIDELLPLDKQQVQIAIGKAISDSQLSSAQANQIRELTPLMVGKTKEEIRQISAVVEQLVVDKDLKREQLKGEQLENLSREVTKQVAAKYGIVIDGNGMTTLITTLLTPKGAEIISEILQNLGKGLGLGIKEGVEGLIHGDW